MTSPDLPLLAAERRWSRSEPAPRVRPARGGRRRWLWRALAASALLHGVMVVVLLLSVKPPPPEPGVVPQGFDMVLAPGGERAPEATKPAETPGEAAPVAPRALPPPAAVPPAMRPAGPALAQTPPLALPAAPSVLAPSISAPNLLPPNLPAMTVPMPQAPAPSAALPPASSPVQSAAPPPRTTMLGTLPPPSAPPMAPSVPAVPLPALPVPAPPVPAPPVAAAAAPSVRLALTEPPAFVLPPPVAIPQPDPLPPPTPPPRRKPDSGFPAPIDLSFGQERDGSGRRRGQQGSASTMLVPGKAILDSPGAVPRDPGANGKFRVRNAHLGKDYEELLTEWWNEHSYYPAEAVRRAEDGTVQIHVKVERGGRVRLVELETRSGSLWLDAGAQAVFRGATLPPFPPSTPEDVADLDITIDYILIRR